MKELLFINACMRGEGTSRTLELCRHFLSTWLEKNPGWTVKERDLRNADLPVMNGRTEQERTQAVLDQNWGSTRLAPAVEFAKADRILIGAPCWDRSFPAALRVYMEWANTIGVTFQYDDQGRSTGICKADKLLFITTMGGPLEDQRYGIDYLRSICGVLGVGGYQAVAAPFTDVVGGPGAEELEKAKSVLTELAKSW